MQRGCTSVALANVDKSNESAHGDSRYSVEAGVSPASMDGCVASLARCHNRFVSAGVDRGLGSSVPTTDKIKNPEQAGLVRPQLNEIKSRLASESDEPPGRMLVGMLGQDSFTSAEMKR